MINKYLKPDGTWHLTRAEVDHINTLSEQIDRLERERDEARAELARLREVHLHGCECSTDEACAFARERDEARAKYHAELSQADLLATGLEDRCQEAEADCDRLIADRDRLRSLLRLMRLYLDGPASADWRAKIDAVLGEDR